MVKKQNASSSKSALRLDERKLAMAGALWGAVSMGLMGAGGMMGGWGMMGGYWGGWVFAPLAWESGMVWGALLGAAAGYVIAWAYNKA
ncbi:Uncharacterised protein [uncultured archaeon]|nr:Uncharacterised protein [uncultured archaeon]